MILIIIIIMIIIVIIHLMRYLSPRLILCMGAPIVLPLGNGSITTPQTVDLSIGSSDTWSMIIIMPVALFHPVEIQLFVKN